jgi:hypothetical protein
MPGCRPGWTGMHGPACMDRLLLLQLLRARACAAACMIDTMCQLIISSAQTQAWKIKFSYRNIREYFARSKGRARGAASCGRRGDLILRESGAGRPLDGGGTFYRAKYSRIFLYENSRLHAYPKCTFGAVWLYMSVLITPGHTRQYSTNVQFSARA